MSIFRALVLFLPGLCDGGTALAAENVALRHQIAVLQRSVKRSQLCKRDRFLWSCLSPIWKGWRSSLVIVQPGTVIGWYHQGFKALLTMEVPQETRQAASRPGDPWRDPPRVR